MNATTRGELIQVFFNQCFTAIKIAGRTTCSSRSQQVDNDDDGHGVALAFLFWFINKDALDTSEPLLASYKFTELGTAGSTLRYPISIELPIIDFPIKKDTQATAEGLLDTGGECTMGCHIYWDEIVKKIPKSHRPLR